MEGWGPLSSSGEGCACRHNWPLRNTDICNRKKRIQYVTKRKETLVQKYLAQKIQETMQKQRERKGWDVLRVQNLEGTWRPSGTLKPANCGVHPTVGAVRCIFQDSHVHMEDHTTCIHDTCTTSDGLAKSRFKNEQSAVCSLISVSKCDAHSMMNTYAPNQVTVPQPLPISTFPVRTFSHVETPTHSPSMCVHT